MVLLHSCLCFAPCPPGPRYTRSILHPSSSCGKKGWKALGFGMEHRVCALLIVTCAGLMARTCQHMGVQSPQQFFPFRSKFPALSRSWAFGYGSRDSWVWRAGLSQLQLGSVTRAGQLPRQEGNFQWEDPFSWPWLAGLVLSCGAPAAQPG